MRLILYVRSGCHLCEDMLRELQVERAHRDFELQVVDVDGDPELVRRYGLRVPVLAADGQEICHYELNRPALHRYFGSA